jgi:hypothetical protein
MGSGGALGIADSPETMPTFYVGDRAIHYRRTGSGTPVVLTPGGRLGSSALVSLTRTLEDHVQLIEWDRSNTGSSDLYLDAPPEQYRWADDAALLVDHLGLGGAIFIGGSAGARLAYLAAILESSAGSSCGPCRGAATVHSCSATNITRLHRGRGTRGHARGRRNAAFQRANTGESR